MLKGIRVLDLTRMLAGPYTSMLLGDLGAEVIKLEPLEGDEIRRMGPPFVQGHSAYFFAINRNKKSVALNLRETRARDAFDRLARQSDVMLDNFRPGVLERLGCAHGRMSTLNPKLVMCSITSFGEEGPMRDDPAFDLVVQAWSGAMSITGEEGGAPMRMGVPLGDLAGGVYAALAIVSALVQRGRTGKGQRIELSLLDCLTAMHTYLAQYCYADGRVPRRQGSGHESCVPYGAFETQDGWIVVAVFTDRFWKAFCEALERSDWADEARYATNEERVRNRATLEPDIRAVMKTRTSNEWLDRLKQAKIPSAPVLTIDQTLGLEQLLLRGMVTSFDHPVAGETKTLADPILRRPPMPPPLLGQHTVEILTEVAGMSKKEAYRLVEDGLAACEESATRE